ncbi:zinc metalloprotease [Myxococcus sp. K15C18031901]|uniref:zinc metalloprotease n=1 Tax=Myxococcus dinghuensis TaxID=2906761 RepID=UPI0020A769BF|nr:M43 family zinc metalloprotease [Myxococcus dinghuensis]MCP3103976.1 zinc metalloprotease [Myxococcus dinghuensis]
MTTIDVWFHVVRSGTSLSNGDVPDSWLDEQVRVLNASFGDATSGAASRFNFVKRGVTRTTNATWFNMSVVEPPSSTELAMKQSLHQGGATTLNIYTLIPGSYLGESTFPSSLSGTNGLALDGVMVHFNSLPGGNIVGANLGLTAVHEVGHWLGLLHPWDGGCFVGDGVSDTPAMDGPVYGCPALGSVDSCGTLPGVDPVKNYMGYVDDVCMWEFTPGQVTRMTNLYTGLRGGVLGSVSGFVSEGLWQSPIISTIQGGAYDYDTLGSSIQVRIYWDGPAGSGAAYSEVTANQPNTYINEVYSVSGNHGFIVTVPASLKDGQPHRAYVYGVDSSGSGQLTHLTYGALTFTIAP